jgi:hypothetical protein
VLLLSRNGSNRSNGRQLKLVGLLTLHRVQPHHIL